MKTKSNIRARLIIHDIGEMKKKEWDFFVKWIDMVAKEFKREDKRVFNRKLFKHTLYKP